MILPAGFLVPAIYLFQKISPVMAVYVMYAMDFIRGNRNVVCFPLFQGSAGALRAEQFSDNAGITIRYGTVILFISAPYMMFTLSTRNIETSMGARRRLIDTGQTSFLAYFC
jgi:hypothetical protein